MPSPGMRNPALAERVRGFREELFGKEAGAALADALQLTERTWKNYESGVTIPAVVILQFIEVCGVNPDWLRSGRGRKYTSRDRAGSTTTAVVQVRWDQGRRRVWSSRRGCRPTRERNRPAPTERSGAWGER